MSNRLTKINSVSKLIRKEGSVERLEWCRYSAGMKKILGGIAVLAVLTLVGCAAETPAATAPPKPSVEEVTPTPTPTPDPTRPVLAIDVTCEQLAPVAQLEDMLAAELTLSVPAEQAVDGQSALQMSEYAAKITFAGGLDCEWKDASGEIRAWAVILPNAAQAATRIRDEFTEASGSESNSLTHALESSCVDIDEFCSAEGFVGDHYVSLTAIPESVNEDAIAAIAGVKDSVLASVSALGAARPQPPLSEQWGQGFSSCAALLSADQLGAELGVEGLYYSPGYSYRGQNIGDIALVAADGFACRYRSDELAAAGLISVLPDAAGALASSVVRSSDAVPIDVGVAGVSGAVASCWSNGEPAWSAGSTGSCTIDLPVRGAWLRVTGSSLGLSETDTTEQARQAAAVVAAALG